MKVVASFLSLTTALYSFAGCAASTASPSRPTPAAEAQPAAPTASPASAAQIGVLLSEVVGDWSGEGVEQVGANTYNIQVTQSTRQISPTSFIVTTSITGTPHPSTNSASYRVRNGQLILVNPQYEVAADIQIDATDRLTFSSTHQDPVTGRSVTTDKDFIYDSGAQSLRVMSEIYQEQNLFQTVDYTLYPAEPSVSQPN